MATTIAPMTASASATFNVQRWVETDRGGLEWEEPQLVARDLQVFFKPLR